MDIQNAICFCLCIWGFPFGFRFHPNSLALSACLAWPVWVLGSPKEGVRNVCFFFGGLIFFFLIFANVAGNWKAWVQ